MNSMGAVTGAAHSTHRLGERQTSWPGAGPLARAYGCTHAFTGAVTEVWVWPRTDDTALPGAAPMPMGSADTDCGFECRALGAPLRKQHLDLGAGTHGGDTALRPGSWLFAALVVGGRLLVAGPGEQMEIHATQPLWARIYLPESSEVSSG